MNGHGKSDRPIVPAKSPNNAGQPAAEEMEGRGLAKGNLRQQNASRTPSRKGAPSALERVRQAATRDGKMRFTALLHHIYNLETLRAAYFSLKREAAPGVDGQTWRHYSEALEGNLQDLSDRLKRGAYRAKPVRRVYIPKVDGGQRPLGVTALEDKLVQRATVEVLNAIYETDFLGFSYGFRPGRSQHNALDALYAGLLTRKVNWVLDVDIRGFFDAISHEWLVKFIEHRIADRRVVRLIQKWLNAGVLEDGKRTQVEEGTPQGGSAAPPTQLTTFARRAVFIDAPRPLRPMRRAARCWYSVDHRCTSFVDLDTSNQRANQLPLLIPAQLFEAVSNVFGKVLQPRNDCLQLDRLSEHRLCFLQLLLRVSNPSAHAFAARDKVVQVQCAGFVRIPEPPQDLLLGGQDVLRLFALGIQFGESPVVRSTPRPFFQDPSWVLHHLTHGVPDVTIELFDSHLWVLADASALEAIGIAADAAVVAIGKFSLPRGARDQLPVERVAAARAHREPLQQVSTSTPIARGQAPVSLELLFGGCENFWRYDRWHRNRNPVLLGLLSKRALCVLGCWTLVANRSKKLASQNCFGLSKGGESHVRRISKNAPNGGAVPARQTLSRGNPLSSEPSRNFSDGYLLLDEPLKNGTYYLGLVQQHLITRWLVLGLSDVEVAVRGTAQGIDEADASLVQLAPTRALQNFGSLVFGDHPLHLHQQLVFGGATSRSIEEDDRYSLPRKFFEQQDLVRIATRQSVGAVHVQNFQPTFRNPVPQFFQCGPHKRGPTAALVDIDVRRQHRATVCLGSLLERGNLTRDSGLLHLLLRRNARVDCHRFHETRPFFSRPNTGGSCFSSPATRTVARRIGETISYATRRRSRAVRVGSNRVWIVSERRGTAAHNDLLEIEGKKLDAISHGGLRPSGVRARSSVRLTEAFQ